MTSPLTRMLLHGETVVLRLRDNVTNLTVMSPDGDMKFTKGAWYGPVPLEEANRLHKVRAADKSSAFDILSESTALYMLEREGTPTTEYEFRRALRSLDEARGKPHSMDPVFEKANLWGFWNPEWTEASYGYESEAAARLAHRGHKEYTVFGVLSEMSEAVKFWRLFARPFKKYERVGPVNASEATSSTPHALNFAIESLEVLAKDPAKSAWCSPGGQAKLRLDLRERVTQGNPLSVAALCAFAWHHGWSLDGPEVAEERDLVHAVLEALMPVAAGVGKMGEALRKLSEKHGSTGLSSAQKVPSTPVELDGLPSGFQIGTNLVGMFRAETAGWSSPWYYKRSRAVASAIDRYQETVRLARSGVPASRR